MTFTTEQVEAPDRNVIAAEGASYPRRSSSTCSSPAHHPHQNSTTAIAASQTPPDGCPCSSSVRSSSSSTQACACQPRSRPASPSIPSSSPVPLPRSLNPHTIPSASAIEHTMFWPSSEDEKRPTTTLPVADPVPIAHTPDAGLEREKTEHDTRNFYRYSSSAFHPIQLSVAPSSNAHVDPAPLYHTTAAPSFPSDTLFHDSNNLVPLHLARKHTQARAYGTAPPTSSCITTHTPSSRPLPSDLEVQAREYSCQEQATVETSADDSPGISTVSHRRGASRGGRSSTSPRKRERASSAEKDKSRRGGHGKRSGDICHTTSDWTTGNTRAGSNVSSSSSGSGSHAGPSSAPFSGSTTYSLPPPSTHPTRHGSNSSSTVASSLKQPLGQKAPISAFRRTLQSLVLPDRNRDNQDSAEHQSHQHIVSWGRQAEEVGVRGSSGRSLRGNKTEKISDTSRIKGVFGYRNGPRLQKTGVPGKNGEEPETDVFKFVDIILDMPDHPTGLQVARKMLKMLTMMTIAYFALMALYFAAEFQVSDRMRNLDVLVVDLDQSLIGAEFLNFTQRNVKADSVNFAIREYESIDDVRKDVDNGNYWGAIVVNENASTTLNKAVSIPLSDYDPGNAFTLVYDSGRDPLVVRPLIVAQMQRHFLEFVGEFNSRWVFLVISYAVEANQTLTPLTDAPQTLGAPIAFREMDLHKPAAAIVTSATSVAYIWIFFVAGASTYVVANIVQPLARKASVRKTMVLLLLPLFVFLCSLSMTYSILLQLFGVPFNSAGQFAALFFAMLLLQSAVASLVLFLIFMIPVTLIPVITTAFVVMNVIAVFHPVELMPPFYRWVYAMPFLNAVQIVRFVLLGSYNRLVYNLPILFAWVMVPITLLPFAITRQKRLLMEVMDLERREQEQQESSYHNKKRRRYRDGQDGDDRDGDDAFSWEEGDGRSRGRSKNTRRRHGRNLGGYVNDTREESDKSNTSDSDYDQPHAEDNTDDDLEHYNTRIAYMRRPRNAPTRVSGVSPSAPPESLVFDTHNRPAAGSQESRNRTFIEMPKLNRHPYAAELVRSQALSEVK